MAAPAPAKPFHLTSDEWTQLVCASAYKVLNARDDKLPRAKRLTVDTCAGGLNATSVRESGPPVRLQLIQRLRHRAVANEEARLCLEAALASGQAEWSELDDDSDHACCFSGLTTGLRRVALFGNAPGTGARTESSHVVHAPDWVAFVEGCMVVGNLPAWLDQLVDSHLPPAQRTITPAELHTLASDTLLPCKRELFRAMRFLFHAV